MDEKVTFKLSYNVWEHNHSKAKFMDELEKGLILFADFDIKVKWFSFLLLVLFFTLSLEQSLDRFKVDYIVFAQNETKLDIVITTNLVAFKDVFHLTLQRHLAVFAILAVFDAKFKQRTHTNAESCKVSMDLFRHVLLGEEHFSLFLPLVGC